MIVQDQCLGSWITYLNWKYAVSIMVQHECHRAESPFSTKTETSAQIPSPGCAWYDIEHCSDGIEGILLDVERVRRAVAKQCTGAGVLGQGTRAQKSGSQCRTLLSSTYSRIHVLRNAKW